MEKIETQKKPAAPYSIGIHRRFYNWVLSWAETRYGLPALILIAFMESSFFPIPPDILLIPLVLGAPKLWARLAAWCTVSSVIGGLLGYCIGAFAWQTVGLWIIENIAHVHLLAVNGRLDIPLPPYLIHMLGDSLGGEYLFQVYDHWNAWIVFVFGLTPLPYKLVTITAGVAQVDLGVFMLTSVAARALRFFCVAWILQKWGEQAKFFVDRYFNLLCLVFVVLLVAGFVVVSLVM